MAVREDLVASAVTFLQDPSVANAPLDKRIAFLQSKNLTQEEIDASLARAGDSGVPSHNGATTTSFPPQPSGIRQQYPPPYGYPRYPQDNWQQPPPNVPQRDWRDYFIMATVMGGLGYGLYSIGKRYIAPLIAPPTPPQLEQDKASIDDSFKKAFDLIDQLASDTAAIKESEEARKETLDSALSELEATTTELKTSSRRRDEDTRRIGEEVRNLQNMIPKAIKAQEENTDNRLRELSTELKSLKTLISNRMSTTHQTSAPVSGSPKPSTPVNGTDTYATAAASNVNGDGGGATGTESTATGSTSTFTSQNASSRTPLQSNPASSSYNRFGGSKGGIPAWQMAATSANKASEKTGVDETATNDTENAPAS